MPVVNLQITKDGVTAEQKARIVAEITETLHRVLDKRPEHTHIIIEEIDPQNWGFAARSRTTPVDPADPRPPTVRSSGTA